MLSLVIAVSLPLTAGYSFAPPGYEPACGPFEPWVRFEEGSFIVSPQYQAGLEVRLIDSQRVGWFRITASTVRNPSPSEWKLSLDRADAVLREVVRLGLQPDQVEVVIEESDDPLMARVVQFERMLSPSQLAAARQYAAINPGRSHDVCDGYAS